MKDKKEKTDWLKKRFDELCDTEPSQVVLDINRYEQDHLRKVLKEYERFVAQFELFYDLIVKITQGVNYIEKSNWPKHRSVQFMLIVHNLKNIYSSFDRLVKGFYEDSIVLDRPAYEAFIKVIYITCYPDDPYSVVSGRKSSSERKFNLTNFVKDELKLDWSDYRLFSIISHAKAYSVLTEAVKISREGQKEPIALKFEFDEKLFELGVNNIIFLLLVYLKIIVCSFATSYNYILKKEMVEKAKELIMLSEKGMSLHPKDYWPQVIKDTEDIFKMIEEVEGGKNWKESWKNIRNPRK